MGDFGPSTLGPESSLWRGIKGEVNLPLGRGKVEVNSFSNTPWAKGPAN